jgi:ribosomal protein S18 acetylase RimI-like enzyme
VSSFRDAQAADVASIVAIMARYYAEDGYALVDAEARVVLERLIADERLGKLWVIDDGGDVVGYLAVTLGYSLEYRGVDAFVDELVIREDHRGRGLGAEAMRLAEAYCRARGVMALHLEVERHRDRAFGLYLKQGFESHDRHLLTKWLAPSGGPER